VYTDDVIYNVRGSFLLRLSHIASYWFAIVGAFVVAVIFDLTIIVLRVTFFPKDVDVFAELEKDPIIKARFEEEAASELQQSWNKGNPDDELQQYLNQPRFLEEGFGRQGSWKARSDSSPETDVNTLTACGNFERGDASTQTVDEEIAQRFGAVIRKPFKRSSTNDSGLT